ncbi:hypothetical protein [Deinococcus budaensis]|uniref:Autotransporter translocation and assembly factor TamB n=1 Tax=Deinococcus budaensis TaxID=1665626 RepID=A0A7W8GHR6_9DEIO|nr:hypothetical protein [Deinococcus budaensis]MBB5235869.1 autotransporter translocation and assembly factor TamB [Deinococcus budaensis]
MLTVHLHLCNGDVVPLTLTPSQRDRLNRTLNQATLSQTPLEVTVNGAELTIPWRSIAYLSTPAQSAEQSPEQAAD